MKKLLLPLLLTLPLASFAANDAPQAHEHKTRHAPLEHVLNLSEAQNKELKTIRQQQFEELRTVNERADQRILEILDTEQREKYTQLKEKRSKHLAEKGKRSPKEKRFNKFRKKSADKTEGKNS